ncbi:hypothetical protein COO91_07487 [Nostoc flagelliforme CCNUN1]|uniref:Uncharacterized protein n=1 Tax=Nostoc flagelliforme CCNUN1 TaxID=2038116 RepID=A0A2K8T191_9NOSO|nr:hypothetical protein COO91_07487 [Nostoc flagelliforme CCNUN1]
MHCQYPPLLWLLYETLRERSVQVPTPQLIDNDKVYIRSHLC